MLVFTSDGVVAGVAVRRVERYDLVKIKPTEPEAEHWFCLCLLCLRSSEHCIVGVASRSGRINQWHCYIAGVFPRYSAPIHWLVHGHMTSNNQTVSRQMPWAGNIAKNSSLLPASCWPLLHVIRVCSSRWRDVVAGILARFSKFAFVVLSRNCLRNGKSSMLCGFVPRRNCWPYWR